MKHSDVCYLCGTPITDTKELTRDHVPALSFFPASLRKRYSFSQLITLPAHKDCNKSYERDEEYFRVSLGVRAEDTMAGKHLWIDIAKKFRDGKNEGLACMIKNEFQDKTPAGIAFPDEGIAKRYDGKRVNRVIWKIVRGLFHHETGQHLPIDAKHNCMLYDSQQAQGPGADELWKKMMTQAARGKYPGVMDYKLTQAQDVPNGMHCCCLLLWDSVAFYVIFHDPKCA